MTNEDMAPILETSIEVAKMRHPSGADKPKHIVLTATDRCDACSAGAAYRVARQYDLPLDFCVHHWKKLFPQMQKVGWAVVGGNPDLLAALG